MGGAGDGDGDNGGDGDGDGDGDAPRGSVDIESGERITARFWHAGDERILADIYDEELETACYFNQMSDGELHCTPTWSGGENGVQVVFTDDGCTDALARTYESECATVRYATLLTAGDGECPTTTTRVFEVGEPTDLPDALYALDYDGNCIQEEEVSGQTLALREMDPDEFVQGEIEVVERSAELGVRMLTTADGFQNPMGLWDLGRDQLCNDAAVGPIQVEDEQSRFCLGPSAYADTSGYYGYADADCTELASGVTHCDPVDYVMLFDQVDGCYETSLYEVGDELDDADVYGLEGNVCEAGGGNAYYTRHYALGDEADLDALPALGQGVEGSARVAPLSFRNSGEWLYATSSYFDTELDTYCYPYPLAGSTYCFPNTAMIQQSAPYEFADSDCTIPIYGVSESNCGASVAPTMVAVYGDYEECQTVQGLSNLYATEVFAGDVYYQKVDEVTCEEVPVDPSLTYYQKGDELDPSEVLVELTYGR